MMRLRTSQPSARSRCSRRGVAIIGVVMLLMIANLVVFGLVLGSGREADLVIARTQTVRAFYAAESGVQMALHEIMTNADEDGDGGVGTISNDDDSLNDPAIGGGRVVVTIGLVGTDTVLRSAGRAGTSLRMIEVVIE
ncbi:MAG: hypothetical protein ACR2GY_12475 [Phycisphaerales bacterium]